VTSRLPLSVSLLVPQPSPTATRAIVPRSTQVSCAGCLPEARESQVSLAWESAVDVQLGVGHLGSFEAQARLLEFFFGFEPSAHNVMLAFRILGEHQRVVGGGMGHPCELATGHSNHLHRSRL
jgi:hypothetical protein